MCGDLRGASRSDNATDRIRPLEVGAAVVLLLGLVVPAWCAESVRHSISYDSDCYTVDGKDIYLYSGSLHYMEYVGRWYDRVLPVIRRHLVANGGGVLLVQLENEYGGGAEYKADAIRSMYRIMRERGIDGPLFTVNTPCAEDNEDPVMASVCLMGAAEKPWMKEIENWRVTPGLHGQAEQYFAPDYD